MRRFAPLLLLAPSFIWLARDHGVWPWDPAWYGENSVDLWWTLRHGFFSSWWSMMIGALGIKAPGLVWLGQFLVPVGHAFGSVDHGLIVCNLACQGLTLMLLLALGLHLAGGRRLGGWLAATLAAAAPLFVGMSQNFFAEPMQVLSVAWFFFIAMRADHWTTLRVLAHLLAAAALGMLAKASTPLYAFAPALLALVRAFHPPRWRERSDRDFVGTAAVVVAGLGLAAITACWYRRNFAVLAAFIRSTSGGPIAIRYGHPGDFLTKLGFWLEASRQSLGQPALLAALGLVVAASWLHGSKKESAAAVSPSDGWLALAGAIEVLAVLAVFCRQINEENRYLLPALPALIAVVAYLVSRSPGRSSLAAGLALAGLQFALTHAVAQGLVPDAGQFGPWLLAVQPDPEKVLELGRLVRATDDPLRPGRYVVSGLELPWFNANTESYYAAKARLDSTRRGHFTSLGNAQTDLAAAWKRLDEMNALYFVSLEASRQPSPPDFLNAVSLPMLRRVSASPDFERVPFSSVEGIILYRRVGPEGAKN